MPTRLQILARGLLVLGLALAPTATVSCKKKPPKLTKDECQRFCRRLVPCFAEELDRTMEQKEDIRECIQNCQSKEGQQHAQILRAMKRCGDIKDCDRLKTCFRKVMKK